MAFDQDEFPSWATRAGYLSGREAGASPEDGRRGTATGAMFRGLWTATATKSRANHANCCQVFSMFVFSRGCQVFLHCTYRATLSAWSASCGGSPDRAGPTQNDLTKRPRPVRVPKRVVPKRAYGRNQGYHQHRLTNSACPLRPTDGGNVTCIVAAVVSTGHLPLIVSNLGRRCSVAPMGLVTPAVRPGVHVH